MSRVLLFLAVAVFSANALFFGCTMGPATVSVTTNGGGHVACMSGTYDGVSTMSCSFKYWNLTSTANVTLCHFHVGTPATTAGPVTFTFDVTGLVVLSGTAYQKFTAAQTTGAPSWQQQGSTSFDAEVGICGGGNGCYFNLHTTAYPGGELRCELAPLTPTYSYSNLPAVIAPSSTATVANTNVTVMMAEILPSSTPKVFAWGYYVSFVLQNSISNAHIHQGTTATDNAGPVKVQFDWGTARLSGDFVGVAVQGVLSSEQSHSNWPSYTPDFDTAIASHFCYVNVHSTANAGGEVRVNISPFGSGGGSSTGNGGGGSASGSSASTISLTLFAVFAIVASCFAL